MKNYFKALLALFLAVCASQPSFGAASTTIFTRMNFENPVHLNSRFYKDTWIDNALFEYPFYMLASPSLPNTIGNYGKFVLQSTLGQDTTFTIPDPGSATASFVVTPGSSSSLLQHTTVALTSANILAMYATPVVLLAAPAAGQNIVVHRVMFTMIPSGTAYTGGTSVEFQIGSTVHGAGTLTTSALAATVVDASGTTTSYNTLTAAAYAGTAATGLYISVTGSTFATGTGTALVDIWYSVE